MNPVVQFAGGVNLRAERVIVLYGPGGSYQVQEGSVYAVTAPVLGSDSNKGLELGAYEPVTLEFVRALGDALGVRMAPEILPERVLCRTQDVVAWWTPPAVRTLFFADTAAKLAPHSGQDFPVPALVWRLSLAKRHLYVRAHAGEERPAATTPLFVAPFLNVYPQGMVCQGTMKRPSRASLDNLADWEDGFFGAAASQQLTPKATTHPGQLPGLWRPLRGKKRFPENYLVDAGQSATQFITMPDRGA